MTSDRKLTTLHISPCPLPLALSFKSFKTFKLPRIQTNHLPYFPHTGTNLTLVPHDSL